MTLQDAFDGQKTSPEQTMARDGLKGILGTAWIKPASRPQKRGKKQLIASDQKQYRVFYHLTSRFSNNFFNQILQGRKNGIRSLFSGFLFGNDVYVQMAQPEMSGTCSKKFPDKTLYAITYNGSACFPGCGDPHAGPGKIIWRKKRKKIRGMYFFPFFGKKEKGIPLS